MTDVEIPYGYCQCGCGQETKISPQTKEEMGWVKGEHRRFVSGHNMRLLEDKNHSPLGHKLNQHLKERNMTQEQFGKAMVREGYSGKISQQTVSNWMRRRQRLHPEFFRCAVRALRLTDEQWIELLQIHAGPPREL